MITVKRRELVIGLAGFLGLFLLLLFTLVLPSLMRVTLNHLHGISTSASHNQGMLPHAGNVEIFSALPLDGGVRLSWKSPESKNYSGIRIRRKENGYPAGPTDGMPVSWSNGDVNNDMGLANGRTYYYVVFSYDTAFKFTPAAYASVYLPWNNSEGTFSYSSSTSRWTFGTLIGINSLPVVSWMNSYSGYSGILCVSFSTATQGVKITAKSRFHPTPINSWYRLRMKYYAEGTTSGMEIKTSLLSYSDHSSFEIRDIAGNWTGNGLVQAGKWYTSDMYAYCRSSSAHVQLVIKNNGSKGNIYIDTLNVDTIAPPAFNNGTPVHIVMGDFDLGMDTTSWAFETPPGESGTILPTCSWLSTLDTQTGMLSLSFDKANEGVKLTSIPTYVLPKGKNAIMTFKIRSDLSDPSGLQVIGYLYGERTVALFQVDLGAQCELGVLPGNTWNTLSVPLTSVSENTVFRLQLMFKNGLQFPETIYIDDVQMLYNNKVQVFPWLEIYEDKN